ncbi:hypothetical protein H310_10473 [Aphanomyces invadans]|uniref:Adhesin domain-containing protein n=1 Tax=Aphanomyces invadans TaxID=157072 RepID=A0A024TQJ9_9STRA|nr:hypothetical protein H310_10473 [Aphanomyces invadans]ETV96308.1 hypothetical protein H310_10473 [Aphanomyces invadans]|eukprot:XP_008875100.1 hypothetical protein H310_10473 [Aphanomyces invadans]
MLGRFGDVGRAIRLARTGCGRWSASCMSTAADGLHRVAMDRPATLKEFQLKGTRPFDLHIYASLSADIELASSEADAFQIVTHPNGSAIRALDSVGNASTPLHVELRLPSQLDLNVSLVHGNATLYEKIEGSMAIALNRGNILADKLRGKNLRLVSNDGTISINTLAEGETVTLSAKQVDCKRLMAKRAEITLAKNATEPLDSSFGALYTNLATIQSAACGKLTVGNVHGSLDIRSDGAAEIHVGSVNGSLFVEDTGDSCNVDVHFDAVQSNEDSSNRVVCGGDVHVSVAPSLPVAVELHGSEVQTNGCVFDGELEIDQLDDDYVIATGQLQPRHDEPRHGGLSGSGKINLDGAKASAMSTSFFTTSAVADLPQADHNDSPNDVESIFVHAVNGKVVLKQLSWMDNIRLKHKPE